MIDFLNSRINAMVIHRIGIKATEGSEHPRQNFYSKHEIQNVYDEAEAEYVDNTHDTLKAFFSKALKDPDIYNFISPDGDVASIVASFFNHETGLMDTSVRLAEKLYNVLPENDETNSEFFVVHFTDCKFTTEETAVDAIGIFKSESKDTVLKIIQNENEINFQKAEGINIKKMDKGAIIFNTEQDSGYVVKAYDSTKGDNVYWIDQFLELKAEENEFFNTASVFKLCKEFDEERLAQNPTVSQLDRINFFQKAIEYFEKNKNTTFDEDKFAAEAIGHEQVIQDFKDYEQQYRNVHQIEMPSAFNIDADAVKKSKRYLRSVIKLDKNFHIYVHSRPEFIEKGRDENSNKSFYKLFFDVES